jgi:transposase
MSAAKILRADRTQARFDVFDLDALLPGDHRARMVWRFVESLDLSEFYAAIVTREGAAGRPTPDPAIFVALWLYATVEGVGSARQLDRLVERNVAYRWIAGGVSMNYHGLADFRVERPEALDRLLTQCVTALVGEGLISLSRIAVDGTKVRARASRGSMKKSERLRAIETEAAQRVQVLKKELTDDPEASSRRARGAQERAARELEERAKRARETLTQLEAEKAERAARHAKAEARKGEPKVSTTDPQAREMRFPDGAFRPAYNAQIAVTPEERGSSFPST